MTILSVLRSGAASPAPQILLKICFGNGVESGAVVKMVGSQQSRALTTSLLRMGGHGPKTMAILPSKFQWNKFKDQLHFYFFLGVIPGLSLVFYTNVFIGPATLSEIPCGHVPQPWEYHRHPITRFMARYLTNNPQEVHERNMFYINEFDEKRRLSRITRKVEHLMHERGDYPNYYTSSPQTGKYMRSKIKEDEFISSVRGGGNA